MQSPKEAFVLPVNKWINSCYIGSTGMDLGGRKIQQTHSEAKHGSKQCSSSFLALFSFNGAPGPRIVHGLQPWPQWEHFPGSRWERPQHGVKAAETSAGLQPHTAKACLLPAALGNELKAKIPLGYPSPDKREPGHLHHLQLLERHLFPFLAPGNCSTFQQMLLLVVPNCRRKPTDSDASVPSWSQSRPVRLWHLADSRGRKFKNKFNARHHLQIYQNRCSSTVTGLSSTFP